MEEGRLEIEPEVLPLTQVASVVVQRHEGLAKRKGVNIALRLAEANDAMVNADRYRLEQVGRG